jgi:hypothetical protein
LPLPDCLLSGAGLDIAFEFLPLIGSLFGKIFSLKSELLILLADKSAWS